MSQPWGIPAIGATGFGLAAAILTISPQPPAIVYMMWTLWGIFGGCCIWLYSVIDWTTPAAPWLVISTAFEWSMLTPAVSLYIFRQYPRRAAAGLYFLAQTVACAAFWVAIGTRAVFDGADFVLYATTTAACFWPVNVYLLYTHPPPEESLLTQISRWLTVTNLILLVPLYGGPKTQWFRRISIILLTIAHILAIPVIIFITIVAQPYWDAWKCYTVLSLPQGFLDKDYGVCNPPPHITIEELWRDFRPAGADVNNPHNLHDPPYIYSMLDPWRGALYFAVHVETLAFALYFVAVFNSEIISTLVPSAKIFSYKNPVFSFNQ